MNSAEHPTEYIEDEINLLDYVLVLLRRKKLIIGIVVLAIAASVIVSLLLPVKYIATARILPPGESKSRLAGLVGGAAGGLGGLAAGLLGEKSGPELYKGILESRTVADILIDRFDLMKLYKAKYRASVYNRLKGSTSISIDRKNGIISISVEDEDPKRAAAMANAYVDALDQINRKVHISSGHRKRVFLEERLKKVKEDLAQAETRLKTFQERYKIIAIDEQARAAIQGAAKIKGEIIAAQTELEVLKQFGTEKQNEAIMLKSKIQELEKQLHKIEAGNPDKVDLYIPFKKMPSLALQLARLMREAKIQQEVFKLITTQYELAKIEEARDVNTIQVLDRAVPPDQKSSPKRRLTVMLSTLVAFFIAVFLAFFLEYIDRIKTEDPDRYHQVTRNIKFWK